MPKVTIELPIIMESERWEDLPNGTLFSHPDLGEKLMKSEDHDMFTKSDNGHLLAIRLTDGKAITNIWVKTGFYLFPKGTKVTIEQE